MKRILLIFTLVGISLSGFSQENLINLSGGYTWTTIDDSDYFPDDPSIKGSGWRINGTYDYNPNKDKVANGFSVGYTSISASYDGGAGTTEYEIAYVTNSYYRNGLMQSALFGIGVKFLRRNETQCTS